jgi:acetoin utilization protein AcuB
MPELSQPADPPARTDRPAATIGDIMSHQVVTVSMDDTLAKAQALFKEYRFHHLLVVERDRLVGVLSDRDLLKACSPFIGTLNETTRDLATLDKRIHQIMTRSLITVTSGASIEMAAELMMEARVSCLPVVTNSGTIEGIVSWRDLLKAYVAARALGACARRAEVEGVDRPF